MEEKMKKQVQVVGILRIVLSSLGLIGAILIMTLLNFVKGWVDHSEIAVALLAFFGAFLPAVMGFISFIGIVAGIGLMAYKGWARILVIILSVLSCFNIPIGTLVGVYSIWVLMQPETTRLFRKSNPSSGQAP